MLNLYETNPTLVTDENFKLLTTHAKYAWHIGTGLVALYNTDPTLVNDENKKLLATHAEYARRLADGLVALYKANPILVNDENKKLLATHVEYAESISGGLFALYKANPIFVNDKNIKLLAAHMKNDNGIFGVLYRLYYYYGLHGTEPIVVDDEEFKLLVTNAQDASAIARGLAMLNRISAELVNHENLKLLFTYAAYAPAIADGLYKLYQVDPALINDENRKQLAIEAQLFFWKRPSSIDLTQWKRESNAGIFKKRCSTLLEIDKDLGQYIGLRIEIASGLQKASLADKERCIYVLTQLLDTIESRRKHNIYPPDNNIKEAIDSLCGQLTHELELLQPTKPNLPRPAAS